MGAFTMKENILGERLKELREQKRLNQKEVSAALGLTNYQLSRYENGASKPTPEQINMFADYYRVSADYLLGRSNKPTMQEGVANEAQANLSEQQQEVLNFFLKLDDAAFNDKPTDMLAALEQFELYYKLYKDQQAKKQL
ncbi:helix-turn-helix domain-containing protein [Caryophanon latum]|uniref:HTH cro/C1-type domain-containing protein n=1 Tax=Caryophanon latum TaxID=33977 RepID=A0A1C0YUH8_9BACL|nr:helix-turn-helix domain-containing protein [Caryophanon latum]OCS90802.1 hypothetical protein A6K76_01770 [Caryophanon latum]